MPQAFAFTSAPWQAACAEPPRVRRLTVASTASRLSGEAEGPGTAPSAAAKVPNKPVPSPTWGVSRSGCVCDDQLLQHVLGRAVHLNGVRESVGDSL